MNKKKQEQDKGCIRYIVFVEQEITSIPTWEDKFLEEVYFEPKWQEVNEIDK